MVSENLEISYQGYVVDVSNATTDIQHIVLLIFRHFGVLGNSIFFIASAWFLLKSNRYKKKKCFFMILEIWTVSIIILIVTYVILQGNISAKIVLESLFPTTFANNWYMTCYLLFYAIHPLLNKIIRGMNQAQVFRCASVLSILYIFIDFIAGELFFPSLLILWVTIYFIIAYIQIYASGYANSIKSNLVLLLLSIICFIASVLLLEVGGLHISFLSNKMMHWINNCNPFLIAMSVALFNIARSVCFKNKFINYISSLSLLIYIIHENLILRTYFRPAMWNYVYHHYGYSHVIAWVFIFVIMIFLFAMVSAMIYQQTIQRLVLKIGDKLYERMKIKYLKMENKILSLSSVSDTKREK